MRGQEHDPLAAIHAIDDLQNCVTDFRAVIGLIFEALDAAMITTKEIPFSAERLQGTLGVAFDLLTRIDKAADILEASRTNSAP